jgi:hypothetical protein
MEPTHTEATPGEDCGTYAGWLRHHRAGEQLDDACAEYREQWCAARRGPRPGRRRNELDLRPCGTPSAARRHYRRGEGLFDVPDVPPRPPAVKLTPGEALRARQADKLARGLHPLTRQGWPPILLHREAAPATDAAAPGLRCGGCKFRQVIGHHDRKYPKCVLPDRWGEPSRATHGDTSDVRKWWPACADYKPKPLT